MSAPIEPARFEMIRAAAEFNTPSGAQPVYQDRADLVAHVDWLAEKLEQAERALAESGNRAAAQHGADMSRCSPIVLYFPDAKARADFIEFMREANPNLTPRAVK